MELLYSTPVAKTIIQALTFIWAHLVQRGPSEGGQSHNTLFMMKSTLGIIYHFSMSWEYPKRLDDFLKTTYSWSEMGLEYQSRFCVFLLLLLLLLFQATEIVSASWVEVSLLVGLGLQNLWESRRCSLRKGQEESSSEKLKSENPRNDLLAEMIYFRDRRLNPSHFCIISQIHESKSWGRPSDWPRIGPPPLAVLRKVLANPFNFGCGEEAPQIYSPTKNLIEERSKSPKGTLKRCC